MNELTKYQTLREEKEQLLTAGFCLQVVNEKQTWKINSFHFQLLVEVNSHYFSNLFVKIFSCFSLQNDYYVIAHQGFLCLSR